jgi:predicted nucleic acid-binding protein
MAEGGKAEYLVSGDKRHVLILRRYGSTHVVTVRKMLTVLNLD